MEEYAAVCILSFQIVWIYLRMAAYDAEHHPRKAKECKPTASQGAHNQDKEVPGKSQ